MTIVATLSPVTARTCSVTGAGRGIGSVVAARLSAPSPLARTTDEDWQRMLDLNLTAPFRFLRADTPMTARTVAGIVAATGRTEEQAREALARRQPIGRLITPEEVADAVDLCVLCPATTGQGINVDGGAVQS